jgi:hypothetical protein
MGFVNGVSESATADVNPPAHNQPGTEMADGVAESVTWLKRRLSKRAPPDTVSLFIATNLPHGARSPALHPLCAPIAGDPEPDTLTEADAPDPGAATQSILISASSGRNTNHPGAASPPPGKYNCSDLHSLGLSSLASWQTLPYRTGLRPQTVHLAVEIIVAAAAPRGLFSTSKFCGPVRANGPSLTP